MTTEELMKLAKENNPAALNELGVNYITGKDADGRDVEKDESLALNLFTKAAELGLVEAQTNLGQCYAYGKGTKKNLRRAADLFSLGASQGFDESILALENICKNKKIDEYCKSKDYIYPKKTAVALFDILGFSNFVKNNKINKVVKLYHSLIDIIHNTSIFPIRPVPVPIDGVWENSWYITVTSDIGTSYASDTFIIWMDVNQHIYRRNRFAQTLTRSTLHEKYPLLLDNENETIFYSNHKFYLVFLQICMEFFCEALKQGIPLRGSISTGNAYFDPKKNIFIGESLVESARAECARKMLGIDFGASFEKFHPVYNKYFIPNIIPARKNIEFTSPFSLDWARFWREHHCDIDCIGLLNDMCQDEAFSEYYQNAIKFYNFSKINANWAEEINVKKFASMKDYYAKVKEWVSIKGMEQYE